MVHCAKCGAELIGSRKFCAACGTPAGDPRSPAASTGQNPATSNKPPGAPGSAPGSSPGSGPSIQYAPPPASTVNPFAQTAGPAKTVRASDYGPPPASIPAELGTTTPGVGDPKSAPQVSPLAVSNMLSQRGAFENAVTAGPEEAAAAAVGLFPVPAQPPSDPAQSSKIPGTQLMPSMANPPSGAPSGATPGSGPPGSVAPATSKRPDRTQLLGAIPAGTFPRPGTPAAAPVPSPSPSSVGPSGVGAPGSSPAVGQPPAIQPAQPMQPPPQHHQAPVAPWNPPPPPPPPTPAPFQPPGMPPVQYAPAPAPYPPPQPAPPMQGQPPPAPGAYGFGYVPGSRVTVTWSNGQRYPGTVQQVSGSVCLVVFPDGQHHWVEMQYVAPA